MDANITAPNEDALCSLLDKGVAWLEEFDSRLKNRAAELERKETDLAHRMSLADQLEQDFAERERRSADTQSQLDEHVRQIAEQEHALRTREQHERGEVRSLREQYATKLRDLDDRDAALKRLEVELANRRRAVEVCEAAIARFQLTFERVLETRSDSPPSPHAASTSRPAVFASEPRTATADAVLVAQSREMSSVGMHRDLTPHAMELSSPTAICDAGGDSWGEWLGPMR